MPPYHTTLFGAAPNHPTDFGLLLGTPEDEINFCNML
jgi:hypothetical protein